MDPTVCIVDTSSLKNATSIEIGGKKLIDWTKELLNLRIPQGVVDEVKRKYQAEKSKWEDTYREVLDLENRVKKSDKYLKFVENWLDQHAHKLSVSKNLHPGEKHCASLALHTAAQEKERYLNFTILDDRKARRTLSEFLRRQGVGVVLTTPELIILIRNRNTSMTRDLALRALADFYQIYQDNPKMPLRPIYQAEIRSCWVDSLQITK